MPTVELTGASHIGGVFKCQSESEGETDLILSQTHSSVCPEKYLGKSSSKLTPTKVKLSLPTNIITSEIQVERSTEISNVSMVEKARTSDQESDSSIDTPAKTGMPGSAVRHISESFHSSEVGSGCLAPKSGTYS